jgi:hypothetical protein
VIERAGAAIIEEPSGVRVRAYDLQRLRATFSRSGYLERHIGGASIKEQTGMTILSLPSVRSGSLADKPSCRRNVRFTPESGLGGSVGMSAKCQQRTSRSDRVTQKFCASLHEVFYLVASTCRGIAASPLDG